MIEAILKNNTLMVLLLAAVLILAAVLLLHWAVQPTMDDIDWLEEEYIVTRGDTLWAISYDYCPADVDRREWIDEIRALNDLQDCTIYPGQSLTVLAPAKEG